MISNLRDLEIAVEGFLIRESNLTPNVIRSRIAQLRQIDSLNVDDESAEGLAKLFEERHGVTMDLGTLLRGPKYEPWLEQAQTGIDTYYWDRYSGLLARKKFSSQVLFSLKSVTDEVLGLLENPKKAGPWDRRGMVVGHVQSGKTANYTGLVCKAADAGYKLIVVIAGIHNNLRNQTQQRIDEGFVGWDTFSKETVGVGRHDSQRRPVTLTNSKQDFAQAVKSSIGLPLRNLNEPAIFVVKKNANSLKNLVDWLREHNAKLGGSTVDYPLLLIDDEADNASINIKRGSGEVSRINGQIRDLLNMFERSGFVGYTATPFANIFIDPDSESTSSGLDLFPRDFIVSLDPPSNYVGADHFFGDDAGTNRSVKLINDNSITLPIKHSIDFVPESLPPSLQAAIRLFVLSRAIRMLRGQGNEHSSMLVNVSRFTSVQGAVRNEIHQRLAAIQASTRINGAKTPRQGLADPEIEALKTVFDSEYFDSGVEWDSIYSVLFEAAAPIKVVTVNSNSAGTLNYSDYDDGLNVIAVGGYSLSRGLTLEGLVISYFLRNSMMYDTLMQMGRWFGYRPGYADLCRVWMMEEAVGWYSHISESIEELRDELRTMAAAGGTPKDFGLRVRSHPDTLIVTARNKMGTGQRIAQHIKLADQFIETSILWSNADAINRNKSAAHQLVSRISSTLSASVDTFERQGGWFFPSVSSELIIDFLRGFQNHPLSAITDPRPVIRYIEDGSLNELKNWDVLIPTVKSNGAAFLDSSLGIDVYCQRRFQGDSRNKSMISVGEKRKVSSRGIEKWGLSDDQIFAAQAERELEKPTPDDKRPSYPDKIYRRKRSRPLLILHLLGMADDKTVTPDNIVLAWSISFPRTQREQIGTEYIVNTVYFRDSYRADVEEDEMGGDDA